MSTSQLSTQSAQARRSAEAELRKLIAKFAPAHQPLLGAVLRWLRKRLPTAHEVVYEYSDFFEQLLHRSAGIGLPMIAKAHRAPGEHGC